MLLKTAILTLLLFTLFYGSAKTKGKGCEISFVVQNEKDIYCSNDTITILIKVKLDKAFCDEAADATKIFGKGLKIEKRYEWKKLSDTMVGQKLVMSVLNNNAKGTLTVYRKTAHYNCFEQKEFKITTD